MGEFCEFEIDFERFDDLRAVVVHDECSAHEDVWFYRLDGLKAENAKLRELVSGYADSFERSAAMNNGNGPYYSGEDWLSLANDMRFDLAEACGELGIEVER